MKKKRALIFSTAYFPFIGGAEVAVQEISNRLEKEYDFDLITSRFDKNQPLKEKIGAVNVYRVGWGISLIDKLWSPFGGALLAYKLHKKSSYTLFWTLMATYTSGAAYIVNFFLKRPVPIIMTFQEGDSEEHLTSRWFGLINLSWKWSIKKAEYITVISSYLQKRVLGFDRLKKVSVIPNGVDLSRFTSGDKRKARKQLNLPEHGHVIVTTSRLVKKNGIDLVIRALTMVPDALFVIAGDGPLRNELEELAKKQKVSDRVKFLGSVPFEKVQLVVQAGDVFVRPSRSEGMGNSFIEAMAMRVPVIGTPVGGIPDFLIDAIKNPTQGTGLVVPSEDVLALGKAINKMLNDESLKAAITSRAYTFVKEHYDWNMLAKKMEQVFNATAENGKKLRVLIATGLFPPEGGGPATYSKTLRDELPQHGFKVDVLPFSKVRKFPKIIRHIAYFLLVLKRLPETDIVYAQDPLSVGLPAVIASKLFRKTFVVKVVGDYAWEQARQRFGYDDTLESFQKAELGFVASTLRSLERWVAKNAKTVVVPSKYLGGIVKQWGVEKTAVIYNGVSLPKVGLKQVIRGLLKFKGELVISPGRLVPWKGFKKLIAIHAELRKKRPELHLLITGGGPDQKALEEYAEKLGVGNSVIFSGNVDNAVVLRYMRAADVLALNTHYEGFSHTLLEAAAIGVPIVTTNIGGNPELIEHGKNGYLVKEDDEKAFSNHINELLDSPDLRAKITNNAKRKSAVFSVEKMVAETANLLKKNL